jgi:hypothetical protein
MPIRYDITRLSDDEFRLSGLGLSDETSTGISLDRAGLEAYLNDSVSSTLLKSALQTLDSTGQVTVEADLET